MTTPKVSAKAANASLRLILYILLYTPFIYMYTHEARLSYKNAKIPRMLLRGRVFLLEFGHFFYLYSTYYVVLFLKLVGRGKRALYLDSLLYVALVWVGEPGEGVVF